MRSVKRCKREYVYRNIYF